MHRHARRPLAFDPSAHRLLAAARIERALTSVLERRDRVTSDLGGGADGGTRAMTQAIIEAMQ